MSDDLREELAEAVASAQQITRMYVPADDGQLAAVSPLPEWCYRTADAVLLVLAGRQEMLRNRILALEPMRRYGTDRLTVYRDEVLEELRR